MSQTIPKFNVGDWVISPYGLAKIISRTWGTWPKPYGWLYEIETTKGLRFQNIVEAVLKLSSPPTTVVTPPPPPTVTPPVTPPQPPQVVPKPPTVSVPKVPPQLPPLPQPPIGTPRPPTGQVLYTFQVLRKGLRGYAPFTEVKVFEVARIWFYEYDVLPGKFYKANSLGIVAIPVKIGQKYHFSFGYPKLGLRHGLITPVWRVAGLTPMAEVVFI